MTCAMTRRLCRVALSLAIIPCLWTAAQAQHLVGLITLTGAQEVPPSGLFVNGQAIVLLDLGTNTLSWNIQHSLAGETAAHFHGPAPAGVNAGIQVPLPVGNSKIGSAVVTAPQAADIAAGLWYINIHTGAFPGGAIRGQVDLVPGDTYSGVFPIDGSQEVPPNVSAGMGTGRVTVDLNTNMLDWDISFSGLSGAETNAHFHGPALAGVNAGIQIPLGLGSPKVGSAVLTATQAADLVLGLWYVNIHSSVFPGGEIRGQVRIAPDPIGRSMCNGDGGNQLGCTDCPCLNNTPAGTIGGCGNSAGTGSRLNASGYPSFALSSGSTIDLRFGLSLAPPGAFCILNSGSAVAPNNGANPCFGLNSGVQSASFDGLRCAIQGTLRHGGRSADANGDVGVTNNPWGGEGGPPAGLMAAAGFVAGQTRFFQVIHRDDPAVVCMTGLNTSQAIEISFTP